MNPSKKLSEIFQSEKQEDWNTALSQYEALYEEDPSEDVSIHFAFLCWYLLWQWDEIQFPGETIPPYERMTLEVRNGISKSALFSHLDTTAKQLLSCPETPAADLLVLLHMEKIYPYFFSQELSDRLSAQPFLAAVQDRISGNPGFHAIFTYWQDGSSAHITSEEKAAACRLFPDGSLMHTYFTWLFDLVPSD